MKFIHWKPLKGVTSYSLGREHFREARISETECRHKAAEVILAFYIASGKNCQFGFSIIL